MQPYSTEQNHDKAFDENGDQTPNRYGIARTQPLSDAAYSESNQVADEMIRHLDLDFGITPPPQIDGDATAIAHGSSAVPNLHSLGAGMSAGLVSNGLTNKSVEYDAADTFNSINPTEALTLDQRSSSFSTGYDYATTATTGVTFQTRGFIPEDRSAGFSDKPSFGFRDYQDGTDCPDLGIRDLGKPPSYWAHTVPSSMNSGTANGNSNMASGKGTSHSSGATDCNETMPNFRGYWYATGDTSSLGSGTQIRYTSNNGAPDASSNSPSSGRITLNLLSATDRIDGDVPRTVDTTPPPTWTMDDCHGNHGIMDFAIQPLEYHRDAGQSMQTPPLTSPCSPFRSGIYQKIVTEIPQFTATPQIARGLVAPTSSSSPETSAPGSSYIRWKPLLMLEPSWSDNPSVCQRCHTLFANGSFLRRHRKYAGCGQPPGRVQCPECQKELSRPDKLVDHMLRVHGMDIRTRK